MHPVIIVNRVPVAVKEHRYIIAQTLAQWQKCMCNSQWLLRAGPAITQVWNEESQFWSIAGELSPAVGWTAVGRAGAGPSGVDASTRSTMRFWTPPYPAPRRHSSLDAGGNLATIGCANVRKVGRLIANPGGWETMKGW